MTPKEKAKELINRFTDKITEGTPFRNSLAKQCALICVAESAEVATLSENEQLWSYYQDVKQEI